MKLAGDEAAGGDRFAAEALDGGRL